MSHLITAGVAAGLLIAAAAQAAPKLPIRDAYQAPQRATSHETCMRQAPVTRAAWQPDVVAPQSACGHLLSTDTLVTVHRWDRT